MWRSIVLLVFVVVECVAVSHTPAREFSDATGKFRIEAELLSFREGVVRLKKSDGAEIEVPIDKLSASDQNYIRSYFDPGPLKSTLADLLREMDLTCGKSGIVAKVAGSRVYVALGKNDGITVGARLAIVRAGGASAREVAANLQVISVQDRLSVCRLLDGTAEQTNVDGHFNKVLNAGQVSDAGISITSVQLAPETNISEEILRSAFADACSENATIRLVSGNQPAAYHLTISASAVTSGAQIKITARDATSGNQAATAVKFHPTGPTMDAAGYRAALLGQLGTAIAMEPVRQAFKNRNIDVVDVGKALFVKDAGPKHEVAWILPEGGIVTAVRKEIADTKQLRQLNATWHDVARTVAGVVASVSESDLQKLLSASSEVYTLEPSQAQSLYIASCKGADGWVLDWPEAKPTWASIAATGSASGTGLRGLGSGFASGRFSYSIAIDERVRLSNRTVTLMETPIMDLQFGQHSVDVTTSLRRPLDFQISAFFREPNGRIALMDKMNQRVVTREILSKPLSDLRLPMPSE